MGKRFLSVVFRMWFLHLHILPVWEPHNLYMSINLISYFYKFKFCVFLMSMVLKLTSLSVHSDLLCPKGYHILTF